MEVDLEIADHVLQGWLSNIYGNSQVFYRSASIKAKDRIQGFMQHLLAQLSGYDVTTYVMGLDELVYFHPIEKQRALDLFVPWLQLFENAHQQSPAFFPVSAWEWVNSDDINKANLKFIGNPFVGIAERSDPYISADYVDLYACEHAFCDWATRLLKPIAQLGQEQKYADS